MGLIASYPGGQTNLLAINYGVTDLRNRASPTPSSHHSLRLAPRPAVSLTFASPGPIALQSPPFELTFGYFANFHCRCSSFVSFILFLSLSRFALLSVCVLHFKPPSTPQGELIQDQHDQCQSLVYKYNSPDQLKFISKRQ